MATYKNGINSRTTIIETARRLFYEKGFRATTYHDISQVAKVRIGTISYHFENLFAIAAQIHGEENQKLHSRMESLFGDSYSAFELAVLEVLVYWRVFFQDERYRRFHAEFQTAGVQNAGTHMDYFVTTYDIFRNMYLQRCPEQSRERVDFIMAALTGVDESVSRYVSDHFSELTPERVFLYSYEIYFSIYGFSREELDRLYAQTVEAVSRLKISNEGFRIIVEKQA